MSSINRNETWSHTKISEQNRKASQRLVRIKTLDLEMVGRKENTHDNE